MKKFLVVMMTALIIGLLSFSTVAQSQLEIPKAQTEPTIDGIYNADEWANAWHFLLDAANPPHIQTANGIATEYYPKWDFYTMWDEENFYFAVVCKGDKTPTPKKMESGMDTRDNTIRGDGVQLFINPSGDYTQTEGKDAATATYGGSYVWTDFYCEYAAGVTPFTWAYEPFDGDIIDKMPDVMKGYIINGTRNGDTYVIEVKAPWKVLNGTAAGGSDQWKMTFPRKAGDKVIFDFNTLDFDGTGAQCRYGITENGARVNSSLDPWKQYTLVDTPAGKAPVVEVQEETNEEDNNPSTSDSSFIMFTLSAISLFGIYIYRRLGKQN